MVSSGSASDSRVARSDDLSVFLATLVWSISVCLMPWIVPPRFASSSRALLSPTIVLWIIAALTLAFAWPVRRNTSRGYRVLTVSLLLVGAFLLTLR